MKIIKAALLLKITATFFWVGALLLPIELLIKSGGIPAPESLEVFIRLLSAMFFALLVGYILGYLDSRRKPEKIPFNTIIVGIVSNGLACAILIHFGIRGDYESWTRFACWAMWASAALTGLITLLLIIGMISFYSKNRRIKNQSPSKLVG